MPAQSTPNIWDSRSAPTRSAVWKKPSASSRRTRANRSYSRLGRPRRWSSGVTRRRPRRLRRSAARGAHSEGGPEPAAVSLRARQDASAKQTHGGKHANAPRTAPGAGEAGGARGPGAPRRIARRRLGGGTRCGRDAAEGRCLVTVIVLMDSSDASKQALALARKFGEPQSVSMDAVQPFAPDALAAILAHAADGMNGWSVVAAGAER